jgi:hypothetical protein
MKNPRIGHMKNQSASFVKNHSLITLINKDTKC